VSTAADVESSQQRMAEIRKQLEAYDPEHICGTDGAGLFFRFLTAPTLRRAADAGRAKAKP